MVNYNEVMMPEVLALSDPSPVSGSASYAFSVNLYEYQGKAHISWSQNFPGRARLAVAIYSGKQPSNPRSWINALEVTNQSTGSWDSGQTWGTGFSASLLAINATNNAWLYMGVDTPVTA